MQLFRNRCADGFQLLRTNDAALQQVAGEQTATEKCVRRRCVERAVVRAIHERGARGAQVVEQVLVDPGIRVELRRMLAVKLSRLDAEHEHLQRKRIVFEHRRESRVVVGCRARFRPCERGVDARFRRVLHDEHRRRALIPQHLLPLGFGAGIRALDLFEIDRRLALHTQHRTQTELVPRALQMMPVRPRLSRSLPLTRLAEQTGKNQAARSSRKLGFCRVIHGWWKNRSRSHQEASGLCRGPARTTIPSAGKFLSQN